MPDAQRTEANAIEVGFKLRGLRWWIVGLIFLATLINYIDRLTISGIDSIHGANYVQGSTLFPQELGMAATRNPALMKRGSEISAMETRAVEEVDIPAAVEAARNSDAVVLWLGEGSYCETPGTIADLTLGEPQLQLAEAIEASGKPVLIVPVEGRPRIINRIVDKAGATLMAYNPGNEGGPAIADALFGDINPSGKLPFTYPRTVNGLITYDHPAFVTEGDRSALGPQFEFSEGLSYTRFGYSDLLLDKQTISGGEELAVHVTLTNAGKRAGKGVAQLYVADLVASIAPVGKRLRRFAKIYLQPG